MAVCGLSVLGKCCNTAERVRGGGHAHVVDIKGSFWSHKNTLFFSDYKYVIIPFLPIHNFCPWILLTWPLNQDQDQKINKHQYTITINISTSKSVKGHYFINKIFNCVNKILPVKSYKLKKEVSKKILVVSLMMFVIIGKVHRFLATIYSDNVLCIG